MVQQHPVLTAVQKNIAVTYALVFVNGCLDGLHAGPLNSSSSIIREYP
jgi:bifunctional ADP-heptose synthase (sugar kinase/adenylyltransferase)